MDNRALEYINNQISTTGWVITSASLVACINPGLYGGGQLAIPVESNSVSNMLESIGCKCYQITFSDNREAKCWARTPANLAQRIEWVTGLKVDIVKPAPEKNKSTEIADDKFLKQKQDQIAALKKVAAPEPPSHDCHKRREILEARAQLKILGDGNE